MSPETRYAKSGDLNIAYQVVFEEGRYIASRIPGARFVEFAGADHSWWTQGRDAILHEIEEVVTGVRPAPESNRVLATVLFTDIVGSTRRLLARRGGGGARLGHRARPGLRVRDRVRGSR